MLSVRAAGDAARTRMCTLSHASERTVEWTSDAVQGTRWTKTASAIPSTPCTYTRPYSSCILLDLRFYQMPILLEGLSRLRPACLVKREWFGWEGASRPPTSRSAVSSLLHYMYPPTQHRVGRQQGPHRGGDNHISTRDRLAFTFWNCWVTNEVGLTPAGWLPPRTVVRVHRHIFIYPDTLHSRRQGHTLTLLYEVPPKLYIKRQHTPRGADNRQSPEQGQNQTEPSTEALSRRGWPR